MKNKDLIRGIGIGIMAGTTIGMVLSPRHRRSKTNAGRAIKAVGDVVENISNAMKM
jgi:gas vesicle protein